MAFERTEANLRAIGLSVAQRYCTADIADDHSISCTAARFLMKDPEVQEYARQEEQRIATIASRERILFAMDTGKFRRSLVKIADDEDHPKQFDAIKHCLAYTPLGPPVQRVHNVNENKHSVDPDQLAELTSAIRDANASRGDVVDVEVSLKDGEATMPSPSEISAALPDNPANSNGDGSA